MPRPAPHATAEEQTQVARPFPSTVCETEHPVVRVRPSGERTLRLGGFVQRFVGISRADCHKLYALFQDHIPAPENTVRWRGQAGDVALWDNTAPQHCAVNDHGDQHRVVRRVTIAGDVPVAVDGQRRVARSRFVKPDAAIAAEWPVRICNHETPRTSGRTCCGRVHGLGRACLG